MKGKSTKKLVFRYAYILLISIGVGSMVKGPVGNYYPLYERYHAPLWLYVITVILLIFLLLFLFNNIFSWPTPSGHIEIDEENFSIYLKRKRHIYTSNEVKTISLEPDYLSDEIVAGKNNKNLHFQTFNGHEMNFLVPLDKKEEFQLTKLMENHKAYLVPH